MAGMAAIGGGGIGGGMGGVGGAGAIGAAGAAGPAGAGGATPAAGSANKPGTVQPSATVTISQAAQKALAGEPTQVGANFSVSQDASGHQYVGGMDANGFSNPDLKATQQVNGTGDASQVGGTQSATAATVDSCCNANGQSYGELNKMSDLVAALLLALLTQQEQKD